jgi:hypothetical protein
LYVNDPVPVPRDSGIVYGGVGMGLKPRIDSVLVSGEVYSHGFHRSSLLLVGFRYGITDQFSVNVAAHFPEIASGFGLNVRPQYSLFSAESPFNIAPAFDAGFVLSDDESNWGEDNPESKGAINADFSMPVSISFSPQSRIIFTPRYSFNTFYFRRSFTSDKSKRVHLRYPALSAGLRINKVHLESTVIRFESVYKVVFGIVYFFE